MKQTDIIILGAGPAGMSCALELSKSQKKVTVIEKEDTIGGFSKTLSFKEHQDTYYTDLGPHRFFSKNPYLYEFIQELLNEDWILVKRKTEQYINKKYYEYPINLRQTLQNIGLKKTVRIGLSYLRSIFNYKVRKLPIKNFQDFAIAQFGYELAQFNILNYTEKIWGIPCKQIHPDWATQRIKGINLMSVLKNAFIKKTNKPKSLVDEFYYPRYGTGYLYQTIAQKVIENGSEIRTKTQPNLIQHKNDTITSLSLQDGKTIDCTQKTIVSSIPITTFITLLDPRPPSSVVEAAQKLSWRSQIYLFLTIDKKNITDNQWIYFPEKTIPFGRISEMKNFSTKMCPKGKTSLFIEFFVQKDDALWKSTDQQIYNIAVDHLQRIGFVKQEEILSYHVIRKNHVYPIYNITYKQNLTIIKQYLDRFSNLHYIGRPGRFHYTNQDHSLEMGILTARNINENKHYDIEKIGTEYEYFEKR